jgi:hypothetical protein
LAILAVQLLGPPLGHLLFPVRTGEFWPSALPYVKPEPAEEGRFLIALLGAVLVPALVLARGDRHPRLDVPRGLVIFQQLVFVGVLGFAVFCRRGSVALDISYFDLPTVIVALVIAAGFAAILGMAGARARIAALMAERSSPVRWGAAGVAAVATVIWLLPTIQLDTTIFHATPATAFDLRFTFDEALSVLNGHSPLVDYAAQYGSLWPYFSAIPLDFGNGSLGAYTASMAFATALAMLAVYGVIRRVVGSPIAALGLFLPFMATSFFIARGTPIKRYSFADYLGVFPLRYAGPFFVLFFLTRHLDGERPRRAVWVFVVAGLAVLNNGDFGIPALGATAIAVVAAAPEPRTWSWLGARTGEGVLGAFGLVSILTLTRTGELPDVSLLFRYARLFALAGYDLLPMPWFGFWVAIYLTFCAVLVVAALMVARRSRRRVEIGALTWVGIFGLGIGAYYVGRSHSEVLIALFSAWALAIVLLVATTVRDLVRRGRRPSPAQLALFAGFGLLVCSLAQFPAPWLSIQRLQKKSPETFRYPADVAFIAAHTKPGEPVVLLTNLGQRISREAGVDDLTPYSAVASMPTRVQLRETIEALGEAGGTKVFLRQTEETWPELIPALKRDGFRQVVATEPAPAPEVIPVDRVVFLSDARP